MISGADDIREWMVVSDEMVGNDCLDCREGFLLGGVNIFTPAIVSSRVTHTDLMTLLQNKSCEILDSTFGKFLIHGRTFMGSCANQLIASHCTIFGMKMSHPNHANIILRVEIRSVVIE